MSSNPFKQINAKIVYCIALSIGLSACTANTLKSETALTGKNNETGKIPSASETLHFSKAVKVARVTGATPEGETLPNPNRTDELYQVNGTDLGILWDSGAGSVMVAFGDTFGSGWIGPGGNGADWRSNVLGISSDKNLTDGLSFSYMVTEPKDFAKQIIESFHDTSGDGDFTSIPTAGISVGTRNFIHYMNVKEWGSPGYWTTNFSELVYSDDSGQNWIPSGVKWKSSSNFAQAALAKENGYVYLLGTASGRQGDIYAARVLQDSILNRDKYEYWDGRGWNKDREESAAAIVQGPAGELSVQYNSHFKRWIMCYLNESKGQIVVRNAHTITGPWSEEEAVADSTDYPGLYGSFIHPWTNDGTDLYFTMSQWDSYNVFLMHSKIS